MGRPANPFAVFNKANLNTAPNTANESAEQMKGRRSSHRTARGLCAALTRKCAIHKYLNL